MNKHMIPSWSAARCMSLLAGLVLSGSPLSAQWSAYGYGGASIDTRQTLFLQAGIAASPGGPGWAPTVGLSAQALRFDAVPDDVTLYTVRPSVGMRYAFQGGSAGFTVGYAFVSKDQVVPPGVIVEDPESGVVLGGSLNYDDIGRTWASQTLASYNLASSSVWARQRFTVGVGSSGRFRAGPEVAYNSGSGYRSYQVGVVGQWQIKDLNFGAGVGRTLTADAGDATYFKVELGAPLFR